MRALNVTAFAAIAALVLAGSPASARPFFHHHHGFWGGPGIAFGIAGLAIAGAVAADACVVYEPVFDALGQPCRPPPGQQVLRLPSDKPPLQRGSSSGERSEAASAPTTRSDRAIAAAAASVRGS